MVSARVYTYYYFNTLRTLPTNLNLGVITLSSSPPLSIFFPFVLKYLARYQIASRL